MPEKVREIVDSDNVLLADTYTKDLMRTKIIKTLINEKSKKEAEVDAIIDQITTNLFIALVSIQKAKAFRTEDNCAKARKLIDASDPEDKALLEIDFQKAFPSNDSIKRVFETLNLISNDPILQATLLRSALKPSNKV